jgi:hypothetical protein
VSVNGDTPDDRAVPRRNRAAWLRRQVTEAVRMSGAARRMLPTVLIVGAQKGGTTSLQHPNVGGSSHKEIHYFDLNADRSPLWYRSHLPVRGTCEHVLDSSPYYLFHPAVPERAHAVVPDAKVIILLRDPVKRTYSHYQHARVKGWETLDFAAALAAEEQRLKGADELLTSSRGARSWSHQKHSYVARSLYVPQLRRWRTLYPPEQILVLRSEDLFADAGELLARVQAWLGLPAHSPASMQSRNSRAYEPLDAETARTLRSRFAEDTRELEEMTGLEFGWG